MKLAIVNVLHELAEHIKVNDVLWFEALQLAEKHRETGLVRQIKALNELNGDKITRTYHTISEIESSKLLK
jgi:type I restriction-modification system DNA methylase subunit